MSGKHVATSGPSMEDEIRAIVHGEMSHFLADIEFRVKQAYDVAGRSGTVVDGPIGKIYAEDLNLAKHQLTGYTVTANSPSAGSIAWASLHVVYNGTDYPMTDANTSLKYVWFDPAATNGTTTLQTSNTKPDLSAKPDAALLFVNNGGTPVDVIKSTIPVAVANNAIDSGAIIAGAVGNAALASGAVASGNIQSGAVGTTQIAGNAVDATKIASGAVGTTQIASGAVGATQIASGAVGTAQIASGAVGASQIANGAVGTAQIGSGSVQSGNIAAGAVGGAALSAGAVTAAKINTLQHLLY